MRDLHGAWRSGVAAGLGIALALLGGALAVGAGWRIGTAIAHWLLVETALAAVMIANVSGIIRRTASKQRPEPPPPASLRRMRQRLWVAAAAEIALFAFAAAWCVAAGHTAWLPALIALLLGADLASVGFTVRLRHYAASGLLLAACGAGALLWLPAAARLGHASALTTLPLLAAGVVLLATAAAGLRSGRRALGVKLV